MGSMHKRFGRNPSVAVCASAELNRHYASEWSSVVAAFKRDLEALLSQIEANYYGSQQQLISGSVTLRLALITSSQAAVGDSAPGRETADGVGRRD